MVSASLHCIIFSKVASLFITLFFFLLYQNFCCHVIYIVQIIDTHQSMAKKNMNSLIVKIYENTRQHLWSPEELCFMPAWILKCGCRVHYQ